MMYTLIKKIVAFALSGAAVAVSLWAVPMSEWENVGKKAAVVAMGMSDPRQSVNLVQEYVEKEPTSVTVTTTIPSPMPSLGGVLLQSPLTTAVPQTNGTVTAGGGTVLTKQLSSGSSFIQGVAIKNNYGQAVDIAAALAHTPALSFNKKETAPQVLIMHTHTTECYLERDDGTYRATDPSRTNDASKNMLAVGEALAAQLKMAGIGVLHDTEIHDQPYTGAYGHSKKAVQAYLKQYPTIRVVLDLHRDAIYPDDNTRIKPTVVINGKKAAQVMIIVGMLNSKTAPNAHVKENLSFAAHLQQRLHTDYPGLMRPLNLANARYNQQLTNGSLLLEMGSDVNTLEEALYAAELVGKGLVQVLLKG